MMLCSVCKKRPAVIFLSLGEKESPVKGLCMRCAQKMDAKSLYDIIEPKNDSIESSDIDKMSEQLAGIISAVDDVQNVGDLGGQGGGVAFLPFMRNIFSDFPFAKNSDNKHEKNSQSKRNTKRRYIEMYCDILFDSLI